MWKSYIESISDNGMEKLEGGGQDVKGLVALAGELDPLEGAHCEGGPAQVHGGFLGSKRNPFFSKKRN